MKRAFDICVAALALAVFAVPMVIIAAAIWAHDGGGALFRQTRVGRGTVPFQMLKFRSMVMNADKLGGYATETGDPRITKIGRFIRRTSLDELPQLLNVLRGDMSIVGPRPDVPAQESLYQPDEWSIRHAVRPGLTGLAQATQRSVATPQDRLRLDLQYVRSASVPLDIKIIFMTIRQVVARTGN
jgi:lipopolysaccharide/colanic/teichoic acid biosynthesis glycosyltransferase